MWKVLSIFEPFKQQAVLIGPPGPLKPEIVVDVLGWGRGAYKI